MSSKSWSVARRNPLPPMMDYLPREMRGKRQKEYSEEEWRIYRAAVYRRAKERGFLERKRKRYAKDKRYRDRQLKAQRKFNRVRTRAEKRNALAAWLWEYKRQRRCEDCKFSFYTYPNVADFHHLDPNGKDGVVGSMKTIEAAKAEIAKCVLLCANCHRIRHEKDLRLRDLAIIEARSAR